MSKSAFRRRVSPAVPYILEVEDDAGKQSISFQLAYDFNAFALVEEKLGKSMLTQIGELLNNPSVTNVSVLLWAALQLNHEEDFGGDQGLRAVRNLLTIETAREALEKCSEAFVKQLSKEKREQLKRAQEAKARGEQEVPLALDQALSA
jgi:hypothetical protein